MKLRRLFSRRTPGRRCRSESFISAGLREQPQTESQSQTGRGKKVLMVDDDEVVLKATSLKLKSRGFSVVTASDGAAAIRAVREEKPDVLLLDIHFPPDVSGVPWDGFLLMSWLRRLKDGKDLPVIFVTGNASPEFRERSQASGATALFQKPLNHDRLVALIEGVLSAGGNSGQFESAADFQI